MLAPGVRVRAGPHAIVSTICLNGARRLVGEEVLMAHGLHRNRTMVRKLFIVNPANEPLYRALRSTLANESDVEIFYDRRGGARAAPWRGTDRRAPSDVAERLRRDGFAVVRPAPPSEQERNIRWA